MSDKCDQKTKHSDSQNRNQLHRTLYIAASNSSIIHHLIAIILKYEKIFNEFDSA